MITVRDQDMQGNICCAVINTPDNFKAGKIAGFIEAWQKLTSESWALDLVTGLKLEFALLVDQPCWPRPIQFSEKDSRLMDLEISKLLHKSIIIEKCSHQKGEFLSNIFPVAKPDGSLRMILNLRNLNKSLEKVHFKMETLKSVLVLIKPYCFFSSVDLKDAYFSVNVLSHSREFLGFLWKRELYQFTCLPKDYREPHICLLN